MKIVHIIGGLNRGGAETWLVQLVGALPQFSHEVIIFDPTKNALSAEIERVGGKVSCVPLSIGFGAFCWRLYRELRQSRADVVHSHVYLFTSVCLMIARLAGVRLLFAHGHTGQPGPLGIARSIYTFITRLVICSIATKRLAVSKEAGRSLFGGHSFDVIYCGIDLQKFDRPRRLRTQRVFQIGHIGRFVPVKNHVFLLDLAAELVERRAKFVLYLYGAGHLQEFVRKKVEDMGLAGVVQFGGVRSDIPRLLLDEIDVLCMPSLFEGLPITLVEAQAANVHCIISNKISPEAIEIRSLFSVLPIDCGVSQWADEILRVAEGMGSVRSSRIGLYGSRFDLRISAEKYAALYERSYGR